ncbi:hypothetical protein FS837_002607 [Tulasnella sp. UAMH 9824]|nr:hypothetical protein FS837_002607 [Tulasnella sp. UAMH 9824]
MFLHIENYYFPEGSVKRLLYDLSSPLANCLKFFEFGIDSSLEKNAAITTALLTFLKSQGGLLELKLPSYEIQDSLTVSEICQALPQLRSFSGEMLNMTKEMFRGVLNALVSRGASLRCVRLTVFSTDELESISLTDMEPMLQLTVIEDIGLWLECKLELKVRDIQQMGQAWSALRSLILFPDDGHGIPLPHLITFAEWFPVLQRFAARFDCSADIPSANEVPLRFKSLRRLKWFGARISDSQRLRVAEFLAVVCGPNVEIGISRYGLHISEIPDEMSPWGAGSEDAGLRHWIDAFRRVHEAINRIK